MPTTLKLQAFYLYRPRPTLGQDYRLPNIIFTRLVTSEMITITLK